MAVSICSRHIFWQVQYILVTNIWQVQHLYYRRKCLASLLYSRHIWMASNIYSKHQSYKKRVLHIKNGSNGYQPNSRFQKLILRKTPTWSPCKSISWFPVFTLHNNDNRPVDTTITVYMASKSFLFKVSLKPSQIVVNFLLQCHYGQVDDGHPLIQLRHLAIQIPYTNTTYKIVYLNVCTLFQLMHTQHVGQCYWCDKDQTIWASK